MRGSMKTHIKYVCERSELGASDSSGNKECLSSRHPLLLEQPFSHLCDVAIARRVRRATIRAPIVPALSGIARLVSHSCQPCGTVTQAIAAAMYEPVFFHAQVEAVESLRQDTTLLGDHCPHLPAW